MASAQPAFLVPFLKNIARGTETRTANDTTAAYSGSVAAPATMEVVSWVDWGGRRGWRWWEGLADGAAESAHAHAAATQPAETRMRARRGTPAPYLKSLAKTSLLLALNQARFCLPPPIS